MEEIPRDWRFYVSIYRHVVTRWLHRCYTVISKCTSLNAVACFIWKPKAQYLKKGPSIALSHILLWVKFNFLFPPHHLVLTEKINVLYLMQRVDNKLIMYKVGWTNPLRHRCNCDLNEYPTIAYVLLRNIRQFKLFRFVS